MLTATRRPTAANEIGADIITLTCRNRKRQNLRLSPVRTIGTISSKKDGLRKVVESTGRSLVLVSGGSGVSDEDTLRKAKIAMDAGCAGLIFGLNGYGE